MASLGVVIANNVRGERARRHMRQADMAEALGWPLSSYGDFETGRRVVRVDDIPQLCEVLGISLTELLRGADPDDLRRMQV
jgi:transcriptional regulator with XRE-family HTH domain